MSPDPAADPASDPWHVLANVSPDALVQPAVEVHWATQLLAAAGQNFVKARGDDSHRAMRWDDRLQGFVGEEFSDGYPFRVGLRVDDLTLHLIDRTDATLGALALGGTTLDDAYLWLSTGLGQYMGGLGPMIDPPDFEIPLHPIAAGAPFSDDRARARLTLAALYGGAAEVLESLAHATPGASAVRCWPHHFDIATLVTVRPERDGVAARTIGVGMAPMGGGYESWYWYVNLWPRPVVERLPELTHGGAWHTDGWVGAVLKGSDIVDVPPERRRAHVEAFVDGAVTAATSILED